MSGASNEQLGIRALHYVQREIRYLTAEHDRHNLTSEGQHALLCFRLMLREVWGKEYRDGQFVFLEKIQ